MNIGKKPSHAPWSCAIIFPSLGAGVRGCPGGVLDDVGGVLMGMLTFPFLKTKDSIPYKGNSNHRDKQQAKRIHVYSFLSR